jgi:hypothetical protein
MKGKKRKQEREKKTATNEDGTTDRRKLRVTFPHETSAQQILDYQTPSFSPQGIAAESNKCDKMVKEKSHCRILERTNYCLLPGRNHEVTMIDERMF